MTTLNDLLALLPDNASGAIDANDLRTIVTELWYRDQQVADGGIPLAQKGTADGVASLDAGGRVPQVQLPAHLAPDRTQGAYAAGRWYTGDYNIIKGWGSGDGFSNLLPMKVLTGTYIDRLAFNAQNGSPSRTAQLAVYTNHPDYGPDRLVVKTGVSAVGADPKFSIHPTESVAYLEGGHLYWFAVNMGGSGGGALAASQGGSGVTDPNPLQSGFINPPPAQTYGFYSGVNLGTTLTTCPDVIPRAGFTFNSSTPALLAWFRAA